MRHERLGWGATSSGTVPACRMPRARVDTRGSRSPHIMCARLVGTVRAPAVAVRWFHAILLTAVTRSSPSIVERTPERSHIRRPLRIADRIRSRGALRSAKHTYVASRRRAHPRDSARPAPSLDRRAPARPTCPMRREAGRDPARVRVHRRRGPWARPGTAQIRRWCRRPGIDLAEYRNPPRCGADHSFTGWFNDMWTASRQRPGTESKALARPFCASQLAAWSWS
jgi:hypothetical protein